MPWVLSKNSESICVFVKPWQKQLYISSVNDQTDKLTQGKAYKLCCISIGNFLYIFWEIENPAAAAPSKYIALNSFKNFVKAISDKEVLAAAFKNFPLGSLLILRLGSCDGKPLWTEGCSGEWHEILLGFWCTIQKKVIWSHLLPRTRSGGTISMTITIHLLETLQWQFSKFQT